MNTRYISILGWIINNLMDNSNGYESSEKQTSLKRVIVNVDPGLDDLYALTVLLYAEKQGLVKIEALLVSYGNSDIHNCLKNTVRFLELVKRTDIPVYKGVDGPLIRQKKLVPYFGNDGFGDMNLTHEPDLSIVRQELAATALHRLVSGNSGEISLICLGPLTDIAITSKLYSDFFSHVKDVWILGGNYEVINQADANTEYNFLSDPKAANMFFDSCEKEVYIYTFENFMKPQLTFEWRFEVLGSPCPVLALITEAEKSLNHQAETPIWNAADSYLTFSYLFPHLCVMDKEPRSAYIELHDAQRMGWIILDRSLEKRNVRIIDSFDENAYQNFLLDAGKVL